MFAPYTMRRMSPPATYQENVSQILRFCNTSVVDGPFLAFCYLTTLLLYLALPPYFVIFL